jgi:cell division septal protein FtsQ
LWAEHRAACGPAPPESRAGFVLVLALWILGLLVLGWALFGWLLPG